MPRHIENTLTLFPELFAEAPAAVKPAKAPAVRIAEPDAEFLAWRKKIETLAAQHDLRTILAGYDGIRHRWYYTMNFVSNDALIDERSNQPIRNKAQSEFIERWLRQLNQAA